jgi:hypothetical protein
MSDQFSFNFNEPSARRSDPETSHEAAEDASINASLGRVLVMKCLARGPSTDFELEAQTGWQQTSIGKRRGECRDAGLVQKLQVDGHIVKRPAPSGSNSIVWEITSKGMDWLKDKGLI